MRNHPRDWRTGLSEGDFRSGFSNNQRQCRRAAQWPGCQRGQLWREDVSGTPEAAHERLHGRFRKRQPPHRGTLTVGYGGNKTFTAWLPFVRIQPMTPVYVTVMFPLGAITLSDCVDGACVTTSMTTTVRS